MNRAYKWREPRGQGGTSKDEGGRDDEGGSVIKGDPYCAGHSDRKSPPTMQNCARVKPRDQLDLSIKGAWVHVTKHAVANDNRPIDFVADWHAGYPVTYYRDSQSRSIHRN